MASPRTKLLLTDSHGNSVINDFDTDACLNCISSSHYQGTRSTVCKLDGVRRHLALHSDEQGKLYVCDDKEKTSKNFQVLLGLIKHCRPSLLKRYAEVENDIRRAAFKELDALEHNIVHINADAINEFYSFITQDTLVTNYWKLHELIAENIEEHREMPYVLYPNWHVTT